MNYSQIISHFYVASSVHVYCAFYQNYEMRTECDCAMILNAHLPLGRGPCIL